MIVNIHLMRVIYKTPSILKSNSAPKFHVHASSCIFICKDSIDLFLPL